MKRISAIILSLIMGLPLSSFAALRRTAPYVIHKPPTGAKINWSHPLSQGLLRCWTLSEGGGTNFYDSVTGVAGTGTVQHIASTYGAAVNFNGTNQAISYPDTGLPTGNSPWTMATLMRTTSSNINILAFSWGGGSGVTGHALGSWGPGGQEVPRWTDWIFGIGGVTPINDNRWHLITATYDGTTVALYLDGNLENSDTVTLGLTTGTGGNLGAIIGSANLYAATDMAGAWVWNRVLSKSELQQMVAAPFSMLTPVRQTYAFGTPVAPAAAPTISTRIIKAIFSKSVFQ